MKRIIKTMLFLFILLLVDIKTYAIERYFYLYDEIEKQAVMDNIKSTYVANENGIDFAHTSSETNGRGVYIDSTSVDEDNKIMYYRGKIDNNYVIFKNYCWQILRTTTDGKIKLLYAGTVTDDKCLAEDASLYAIPNKIKYNLADNADNIGYMIPDEAGTINAKDSNIKSEIDKWFEEKFGNEVDNFADTIFCNDREYNSEAGHYNGWKRLQDGKPTFACAREEDSFSIGEIGNGKLTYPVALINTDELMYAGAQYNGVDTDNYYDSWTLVKAAYWAMTPNSSNKILYPNSLGFINRNSMTASSGVRPLIAINNDVLLLSGLGTREKPYNVPKNQEKYKIEVDQLVDADIKEAIETQPVEIRHENKDGYSFKRFIFINSDTNEEINLEVIKDDGKTYIRMPKHNIIIKSEWEEIPIIDDEQQKGITDQISTIDNTEIVDNPVTTDHIALTISITAFLIIMFLSFKIKKYIRFYNKIKK